MGVRLGYPNTVSTVVELQRLCAYSIRDKTICQFFFNPPSPSHYMITPLKLTGIVGIVNSYHLHTPGTIMLIGPMPMLQTCAVANH